MYVSLQGNISVLLIGKLYSLDGKKNPTRNVILIKTVVPRAGSFVIVSSRC